MSLDSLRTPSQAPTLGVYVSVPFCRAKCSFCNFASGVSSPAAIDSYISRLCAEINSAPATAANLNASLPRSVDTLYFGGGTPSLLDPAQLRRIFAALHNNFDLTADAEITLEAAPGQISEAVLDEVQRLGVNRVSLGVQSFVDRESAAVGRSHTARDCIREIVRLQSAGIAEVCADLIAGLPYQTTASWQHSLDVATSVGLTHLSVYMLEIDEDSRLGREVIARGPRFHAPIVPEDDSSAEFYETACDWLSKHGFPQYEISNFADTSHQSLHNRKYWRRAPYFGFGLDAHSMLMRANGAVRFANPDELVPYSIELNSQNPRDIVGREAFDETIFLGLRMNEGVSISQLRQDFPSAFVAPMEDAARGLISDGLMLEHDNHWQLTLRGRLISNDVFTNLLMGIAA